MKTASPRLHLALSLLAGLFAATASHAAQRYADRPEAQLFIEAAYACEARLNQSQGGTAA